MARRSSSRRPRGRGGNPPPDRPIRADAISWKRRGLEVHGVLRKDYADNIWGSELRLARPEARTEGLLGLTFFLGDRVRVGLAAQPFYFFAAGTASMECYLCSQKDVRLVSFRADKGIALQLSLSVAKHLTR